MKQVTGIAFTESGVPDTKMLNAFVYECSIKGEVDPYSEQEHFRWLMTKSNMENLYSQLHQLLGKSK